MQNSLLHHVDDTKFTVVRYCDNWMLELLKSSAPHTLFSVCEAAELFYVNFPIQYILHIVTQHGVLYDMI